MNLLVEDWGRSAFEVVIDEYTERPPEALIELLNPGTACNKENKE
jgi:hypothetical protein